jgi:DNA-binding transcriptional regulator YbjK
MPVFDAELREQARKDAQPALASAMENKAYADANSALEQKLAAQLEDLFARKSEEFSSRLEGRLQSFYEQTASRLDLLSEGVVRHFCEVLNRQVTEALSTVTSEWVERNRALVNAEYHAALDRFAARLESISSSRLEGHRKEINNLSSTLKIRLRSVAHALEELGPAPHRT